MKERFEEVPGFEKEINRGDPHRYKTNTNMHTQLSLSLYTIFAIM